MSSLNLGTLTILLGVTTSGVNKAIRDVNRLGRTVDSVNAQMLNLSRTMLTFATFPTVVLGAVTTKAFSDFEYNLSKITGIIGIAEEQTKQWGKEILELAPKFGASAKEMSNSLYYIASADPYRPAVDSMEILTLATKAAEAGLGDINAVADLTTSVMNAYGKENISAAETVDALIYGVREGKTEAEAFAKVIGAIIPMSSKLGMSFQEVAGAAAMLGRTGTNAAAAATQVRRMLMTLVQQPEKGIKVLDELGSSYNGLIDTLRNKGLLSLLTEIKNLSEFKGEDFLADVFPNIRALLPVLDMLGENWETNIGIMERSKTITGELDKMWGNYTKTMRYAIRQVFARAGVSAIEFGHQIKNVVIPILSGLTAMLSTVIKWFTSLDSSTKETIVKITLFAAAFGPLYIAITSIITVALTLIKTALLPLRIVFAILAGAVKILVGGLKGLKEVMLAIKAAALANPYMLLAGALLIVAYTFTKVKDTSVAWVGFLDAAFKRMHIWFLQFGSWVLKHLERPLLGAIKLLNSIMPEKWAIGTDWNFEDEIQANTDKILELEKAIADNPFAKFGDAARATWDSMKDDFKGLTDFVSGIWNKMWEGMNMGDLNMPSGTFGPTGEIPTQSIEEFMAEVTKGNVLINEYIYNPFEKVDQLILDTWADLALMETQAKNLGGSFNSAEQGLKLVRDRLEEVQELMLQLSTSGGAKGPKLDVQMGEVKKLEAVIAELTMTTILDKMNSKIADADKKAGLFGKSWTGINLQAGIYQDALNQIMDLNIDSFDEQGLQKYKMAVLGIVDALNKVTEAQEKQIAKLEYIGDMLNSLGSIFQSLSDARMEQIDREYNEEIARAGKNAEMKARIEEDYQKKRAKLERKAAMMQKLFALFQIAIDTAVGVMKATAALQAWRIPWIVATGALSAAAVMAQPIPGMKEGGIVPQGYPDDTYPAMLTSGEMVLPPKKLPNTNDILSKINIPNFNNFELPDFDLSKFINLDNIQMPDFKDTDFPDRFEANKKDLGRLQLEPLSVNVTVEGVVKGKDIHYIVKEVERKYQNSH